ncbi:MAG: cell division protein SepF [Candidatus Micrarchaeota archaeon]
MGILDKIFGSSAAGNHGSLEEAMNALEDEDLDVLHAPADYYVKPMALEGDGDLATIEGELKARNVVLLNIAPMARNPPKLKESLSKLSSITQSVGGDIARISEDKILLTPARMQIKKSSKR